MYFPDGFEQRFKKFKIIHSIFGYKTLRPSPVKETKDITEIHNSRNIIIQGNRTNN